MTQSHFNGKRAKRKKERALRKGLAKIDRSVSQFTASMKQLGTALDRSALAIGNYYTTLLKMEPRNFRHKKKLLNRKELKR